MITTQYAYSSGSGFTYNSAEIAFPGGICALLDRRPASATFYAAWTSMLNGNWSGAGNGSLTVTANSGAAIAAGVLNLTGGSSKNVQWVATNNCDFTQHGSVQVQFIPAYSGVPSTNQFILAISETLGSGTNAIVLLHNPSTGHINLTINDQGGASILSAVDLGVWHPTSGQTYTLLLQVDITGGNTALFINGTQQGTTQTATGTRGGAIALAAVGIDNLGDGGANFSVLNFSAYNAVVTPAAASFAPTIYATDDSTIQPTMPLSIDNISALTSVDSASGSDGVGFVLNVGGTMYWWTGSAWAVSNLSFAQSSTAAQILANQATIPGIATGIFVTLIAVLHSATGATTPTLTSLTITYDYFGPEPPGPNQCTVFGYIVNESGVPISGAKVTVSNPTTFFNQGVVEAQGSITVTTDSRGYFSVSLDETTTVQEMLNFSVVYPGNLGSFVFGNAFVPNTPEANITTLVGLT